MALREHQGVGAQRAPWAPWWCAVWMIPLREPIPGDPGCATSGAAPKAFVLALSKGILWMVPGDLLSSTPRGSLQRGSARRTPLPGRPVHFRNYFTFPLEFLAPFSTHLCVKETGGGLSPPDLPQLHVPSNPPHSPPPFFAQNPQPAKVAPCACCREETQHPPRTSPFPFPAPKAAQASQAEADVLNPAAEQGRIRTAAIACSDTHRRGAGRRPRASLNLSNFPPLLAAAQVSKTLSKHFHGVERGGMRPCVGLQEREEGEERRASCPELHPWVQGTGSSPPRCATAGWGW